MNVEERLRTLMAYQPPRAAVSATQIIARARRARRRNACTGAIMVLGALGGTIGFSVHGSVARAPSATIVSAMGENSPHISVPLNQRFALADGLDAWLTRDGMCTQGSDAFWAIPAGRETPVTCAQYDPPSSGPARDPDFTQFFTDTDMRSQGLVFITGAYRGTVVPSRIIVRYGAAQATATVVTSPTTRNDAAFYAQFTGVSTALATGPGPSAFPSIVVIAYDTDGRVLVKR